MSSGNLHQDRLDEELDAAIEKNAPSGKLEDAEIQRLVQLSNDASYQRSERVPVKTAEAFEPRSLVSIAISDITHSFLKFTTLSSVLRDLTHAPRRPSRGNA